MDNYYYRVLEVNRDASQEDIQQAYLRLILRLRPDKNPNNRRAAEARYKAVCEAYYVLSNEARRRQYDQFGCQAFGTQPLADTDSCLSAPSGCAYAFTFREPDEVFREFFGAAGHPESDEPGPCRRQRGGTVLASGQPFWQNSFLGDQRPGFLFNADDMAFAAHAPGFMTVAPGFVGTPTQHMSSTWYEGGKRIEVYTLIEDGAKSVVRFEDGVSVPCDISGAPEGAHCTALVARNPSVSVPPVARSAKIGKRQSKLSLNRPPQLPPLGETPTPQQVVEKGVAFKAVASRRNSRKGSKSRSRSRKPTTPSKGTSKSPKKDDQDGAAGSPASPTAAPTQLNQAK
ncbi:hypothetical protein HPB48_020482 [Haemaphysalis longicornis]|uniref:J domain-containing protein n=1 Tax=Haemaphysalis longicornis TaxID=44386 RepID=A0A9J6FCP5_HAELO|nr:hypothetical protein HPB48_020482 [Haemaphysalis longicornis]